MQITIDDVVYNLVPAEPKLPQSYEECFRKINPTYYINNENRIIETVDERAYTITERDFNLLPTVPVAQQIQAAMQLSVVCAALNAYEPTKTSLSHTVTWDGQASALRVTCILVNKYQPTFLCLKSSDLASQAINIAKELWIKYYGV